MKPWICEFATWIGIAFVCAIGVYLLLHQCARLSQIGFVSLASTCMRMNPIVDGFWTFVTILTMGAIRVLLHELKRHASNLNDDQIHDEHQR